MNHDDVMSKLGSLSAATERLAKREISCCFTMLQSCERVGGFCPDTPIPWFCDDGVGERWMVVSRLYGL